MSRARTILLVVLLLATAAGCRHNTVRIATGALDDLRSVTRLSVPETMELGDDAVSRLARQGGIDEGVIREVAPELDSQPQWKSSLTSLREIYNQVPEDVRSGSINIVCGFVRGDINSPEEFQAALLDEFGPKTEPELVGIMESLMDYANDMGEALRAGDELAASVVLTCYIAEQSI